MMELTIGFEAALVASACLMAGRLVTPGSRLGQLVNKAGASRESEVGGDD